MKDLLYYYNLVIEEARELVQAKELTDCTYRHYKVRLKIITEYLTRKGQIDILPSQINLLWVKQYETSLLPRYSTRNCVNKHIQHLGKVLRYAVMDGEVTHNPVRDYVYKYDRTMKAEYLTVAELKRLRAIQLPLNLEKVRDVYVFCCFSGLAYIDVQAFDPIKNIVNNKYGKFIVHSRSKTNVEYCVPVSKPIEDILLKYPEKLPTISNQKYNENLKKVMKMAGIGRKLTSHSARKTFAMMAHNEFGVPIDTVSKMLGHTSVQTTQAYYAKTDFQKVSSDMKEVLLRIA